MRNVNWWRFFGVIGAAVFCVAAWVGIFAAVDALTGPSSSLPDGVAGVYGMEVRDKKTGELFEVPWVMELKDGLFVMSMGDKGTKLGPECRWEYEPGDGIAVRITDLQGYHVDIRPIGDDGTQLALITYTPTGELELVMRATKLTEVPVPRQKSKRPPTPSPMAMAEVMP